MILCRAISQSAPPGGIANAADLVTQHSLQIGSVLADDFPAVEERVL